MALHRHDGTEATTILATRGEAGPIADPSLATRENLGEVREREARQAYATLGFADHPLHFLGYPDGALADVPRDDMARTVVEILESFRPDVVVTFGPEGVTRHDDHVAVHHVASEAFSRLREGARERGGPRRLLYVAIPRSRIALFQRLQREAGMEPFNPDDPFQPRGVPDETIAVTVDASSVWREKYDALLEHRTQAEELEGLPEAALPVVFGEEHFVQGWPHRDPGSPMMRDVFEGLGTGEPGGG